MIVVLIRYIEEFNATVDNLDRLHLAGEISNRNLKYRGFLDEVMEKIGCFKN
ncbi:hypothetical protein [Joostella sp. CR20]|uniref:hypothetical protein n=1 Tax=Joostella sp. CR20 TaxID=2804312 RepID=UPI00313C111B